MDAGWGWLYIVEVGAGLDGNGGWDVRLELDATAKLYLRKF